MRSNPHPEHRRRRILTLLAALGLAGVSHAQGPGQLEDLARFPSGKLQITDGAKVRHTLDVWLADTPRRQAQGLMFVRFLPDLKGMLFVHESPRPISMWMKNTYIPLDMVFIDARGRIQQIIEHTTPHSLEPIRSREAALAVLEIPGGASKRLGLEIGNRVIHPALVAHRETGRLSLRPPAREKNP